MKNILKNEKAFTGLEAAIVLTAFVVVAAVFSYTILGAGFFTTEKAKQVVHTGVEQATSSVALSGDVIAKGGTGNDTGKVTDILVTLVLSAGRSPIAVGVNNTNSALTISYTDKQKYESNTSWNATWIEEKAVNGVLEYGEKVQLTITVPTDSLLATAANATDAEFTLNVKPKEGAMMPITKRTPSYIDPVMILY